MEDLAITILMTEELITINCNEVLSKAAEIFEKHSFHHLPVVDDSGALMGIISRTDMDKSSSGLSMFRNPRKEEYDAAMRRTLRACDIMTKDVISMQASDSMKDAYKIFKKNKVHCLPIEDKGILVGIVTPLDLLDYFFTQNQ